MKRSAALLMALALLAGCEPLNDALVRMRFYDAGFNRSLHDRIREGLERRDAAPPEHRPRMPAPDFLDQG